MALELKFDGYTDNGCENLLFLEQTGLYSAGNLTGFNSPNLAVTAVDNVNITLTILGVDLVYAFTVVSGTITAATATLASGTPVDILSLLTSTVFPFPDALILTPTYYSATFPELEDMVYEIEYEVIGAGPVTYTATEDVLVNCATCCCINKALTTMNINNADQVVKNLIPIAYMETAQYATDNGDIDQANEFITKAYNLCQQTTNCGSCGC